MERYDFSKFKYEFKPKGKRERIFSNPSAKRAETLRGPARANALSLLGPSHRTGHGWHHAAQRQLGQ
jgi:hypothetical protein